MLFESFDQLSQMHFTVLVESMNPNYGVFVLWWQYYCKILAPFNFDSLHQAIILIIGREMTKYHSQQNGTGIYNLVQFKLMESDHSSLTRPNKNLLEHRSFPNRMKHAQVGNFRTFQSCHFDQARNEKTSNVPTDLMLGVKQKRCESTTKILTLRQLKIQEEKLRQKRQIKETHSRMIFISISKGDSSNKQKSAEISIKKQNPELNMVQNCIKQGKNRRSGISVSLTKGKR